MQNGVILILFSSWKFWDTFLVYDYDYQDA